MHKNTSSDSPADENESIIMGLTRARRFRIYRLLAISLVALFGLWMYTYLSPHRWYTYTDVVSFKQSAHDVKVGYVMWQDAEQLRDGVLPGDVASEPCVSADGTRLLYAKKNKDRSDDLFLRRWNGTTWSKPRALRALNSNFEETSPSLSGDGKLLFFSSNRPGGRGGFDIWVARWDGAEYAWPLPLTNRVNTPFDEKGPAISPDNFELYFTSNRPRLRVDETDKVLSPSEIEELKTDFDIFSADIAGETPYDLKVERQLSMLYSLRENALGDSRVMSKLGGTRQTEAAVDKALAYLAAIQSADGRWDMSKYGGKSDSDMAGTGAALLAFYGRGQRHDEPCKYQEVVQKGITWLVAQQDKVSGDLRGIKPRARMYNHGIASLAMVEAYGVTKDLKLRPRAQSAIEFIEAAQHREGGWRYAPGERGDLSVSGWMIMVLASAQMSGLDVKPETLDGARKFLDHVSSGRHGGAFGYTDPRGSRGHSPSMNAVGFFCRQLLGLSNNSELAWEASSLVDGRGFNGTDLYYAYYGTLASYQHQGPAWRRWMDAMKKQFVRSQRRDGSWVVSAGFGRQMGTIIATALVTLSLEAHYRYTPLYGLGFEPDPSGPMSARNGLLDADQIPDAPLFRHAQHIELLSSPADESDPVITDHGDFLYFASAREGGFGGADIYRSRFEHRQIDDEERLVVGEPKNVGPEINSNANESAPAPRLAGFQLLFSSDRGNNSAGLFVANSRRVERRHSVLTLPSVAWLSSNFLWLLGMALALFALVFTTRRAMATTPQNTDKPGILSRLPFGNWQR